MLTFCWMVNINSIMFPFLQASRKLSSRLRMLEDILEIYLSASSAEGSIARRTMSWGVKMARIIIHRSSGRVDLLLTSSIYTPELQRRPGK